MNEKNDWIIGKFKDNGFVILDMPKIPKGYVFKEADYNHTNHKIHVRIKKVSKIKDN